MLSPDRNRTVHNRLRSLLSLVHCSDLLWKKNVFRLAVLSSATLFLCKKFTQFFFTLPRILHVIVLTVFDWFLFLFCDRETAHWRSAECAVSLLTYSFFRLCLAASSAGRRYSMRGICIRYCTPYGYLTIVISVCCYFECLRCMPLNSP